MRCLEIASAGADLGSIGLRSITDYADDLVAYVMAAPEDEPRREVPPEVVAARAGRPGRASRAGQPLGDEPDHTGRPVLTGGHSPKTGA